MPSSWFRAEQREEPSTCPSLLRRAVDGDAESWRSVAQIYGPVIYGWARRCGCQSADAADVMQETLAAISRGLARFEPDCAASTFRGWLWTIARNKIRDHYRDATVRGVGGTDAQIALQQSPDAFDSHALDEHDPPSSFESDSTGIRQRTLVLIRDSFDRRQWRMFWETTIQQRDAGDVAEEMGVSRWAVYKARARVLQRLKQECAEWQ